MLTAEAIKVLTDAVEQRIRDALEIIIPEVKQLILDQKKKSLLNKGQNDWDQTPFPDIKESTIRRKKKYPNPTYPLYRSGDLEQSLYMNDDGNDFDAHSDLSYVEHVKAWENSKGNPHPFDELTDKEYDMVLDEIEKRLQDAINQ